MMRTLVSSGTPAINTEDVEQNDKIVKSESELLLDCGLTHRVVRDSVINGTRTLDMEVLAQ